MSKKRNERVQFIMIGALLLLLIINLILVLKLNALTKSSRTQAIIKTPPTVMLTILADPTCTDCVDAQQVVPTLEKSGVTVNTTTFEVTSSTGKKLVSQYNITRVPAIIFSPDITKYAQISGALAKVAQTANDGSLILNQGLVPYRELATGRVRGIVDVTYLNDSSCTDCYDVRMHDKVLQRLGVRFGKERLVDVASKEGRILVQKYNISAVPTIILSSEAQLYPALIQVWPQVGTRAADGTLVFRKLDVMGTYKNLETNEVIVK